MAGREERDHEFTSELEAGRSIRFRFDTDRGRVTAFTVQLEVWVAELERWRPVVRYDDAHGAPHRDILDWDGRVVDKLWLPPGTSNEAAMAEARRDISTHHPTYVEAFWRTKP